MQKSNYQLAVVMPVYNEEQIVGQVIKDWTAQLSSLGIDFYIHTYNDGSRDGTEKVLDAAAASSPRVKVHHKLNSGHGPTILQGYRENTDAEWIFQVDSDNEILPQHFGALWKNRDRYDFLIGERTDRHSPFARRIISLVALLSVRILCGTGIKDVNAPFRLIRTARFKEYFDRIPVDTFAPNVVLSMIVCRKKIPTFRAAVPMEGRKTGSVSIKSFKLFKAAVRSWMQTVLFRLKYL